MHALRTLRRTPGFSLIAILVVAVGIGTTTAIFSVVNATLLRPLPFREPDRLFRVYESTLSEARAEGWIGLSVATFERWRQQTNLFATLSVNFPTSATLTGRGEPQYLPASRIDADFLPLLGVAPALGRNLTAEEDRAGSPVVLISDALWRRAFNASPQALGEALVLDGQPHTVIGVMAPGFRFQGGVDLWLPIAGLARPGSVRGGSFLWAGARLQPGVSAAQAADRLRELCAQEPIVNGINNRIWRARLNPLRDEFSGQLRPSLLALAGAAGAVLLIAGANLAALLLARAIARSHETALRAALGATRAQLTGHFLAPGLVLAFAGGVVGLGLAALVLAPLVRASPVLGGPSGGAPILDIGGAVRLDGPTLACGLGGALLVGLVFSLLPAWHGSRVTAGAALRSATRSATGGAGRRFWLRALVTAEIALAVVLLAGAGYLARVFARTQAESWGFSRERTTVFDVTFPATRLGTHGERTRFTDDALARLRALPGIESAAFSTTAPLFAALNQAAFTAENVPPPPGQAYSITYHTLVPPDYFRTLQTPLRRGRDFTADDRDGAPLVVIVSETLARQLWPGQDPVGKRVKRGRVDSNRPWMTVVGVAADVKSSIDPNLPGEPGKWYLPFAQHHRFLSETLTFVIRSPLPLATLEPTLRAALRGADPDMALYNLTTLAEQTHRHHATERFNALLVSLFGGIGLLLAAGGLYGLLSFHVAQRTRELGVRAALGAGAGDITRLILGEGVRLWAAGVGVGLVAVAALSKLLPFGGPDLALFDPQMSVLVAVTLGLATLSACLIPARRAARVDPMIALRAE